jgi:hypothetical protein
MNFKTKCDEVLDKLKPILEQIKDVEQHSITVNLNDSILSLNISIKKDELPSTWEEWFESLQDGTPLTYLNNAAEIKECVKNATIIIPEAFKSCSLTKESTEAHLAMIQLENLKNAYNDSVGDNYKKTYFETTTIEAHYVIENLMGKLMVSKKDKICNRFLSFKTKELAEKFLENFRPLIETAKKFI